jgi:MazG family protein
MWGQRCQKEGLETTPPFTGTGAPEDGAEPRSLRFSGPGVLDRALALVRFLRARCPWDREQTAQSLVPHLLEEAHEVADAVHDRDAGALAAELGDLLLNLAFQIVVAEEAGSFDAESVYARLEEKMVARHPHLFGDSAERSWEALKAEERAEHQGLLSGLAKGLDPLTAAHRIQERVSSVGFDWPNWRGALAKVSEELAEASGALAAGEPGRAEEELGDLLFAVVNVARLAGVHPTNALAHANRKFRERFERLERLARERGLALRDADLAALDALWNEVKRG